MTETILNIEEVTEVNLKDYPNYSFDGFKITTNERVVQILIDNDQQCCERWGYISTPEETAEYVGAKLVSIEVVDYNRNTNKLSKKYYDEEDCLFVNVNTDIGTIDFAVYNAHNGWYGHKAILISDVTTIRETVL